MSISVDETVWSLRFLIKFVLVPTSKVGNVLIFLHFTTLLVRFSLRPTSRQKGWNITSWSKPTEAEVKEVSSLACACADATRVSLIVCMLAANKSILYRPPACVVPVCAANGLRANVIKLVLGNRVHQSFHGHWFRVRHHERYHERRMLVNSCFF